MTDHEEPEDYDAAVIRIRALEKRQSELLATIVRITNETPFPDEIKSALEQRGKLLAEVGTLRADKHELETVIRVLQGDCAHFRGEIKALRERVPREPFDVRAADALADEVYILVQRHVIDARSPAADALLDYRAAAPRADRIIALEQQCKLADSAVQSCRERMAYLEGVNETLRDFQFKFSGEYVTGLEQRVTDLHQQKNDAYVERSCLVAALAWFALDTRRRRGADVLWFAGVGRHQPDPDPNWDVDWLTVVYIDTPHGQLSWHLHDNDLPMFEGLPSYHTPWDGHTTDEKYERLGRLFR